MNSDIKFPQVIKLLKCKPVDQLLDIMDQIPKDDITMETTEEGYRYYLISTQSRFAKELWLLIRDLNIVVDYTPVVLSDYIMGRKKPKTNKIIGFIDFFTVEQLFCTSLTKPRIWRIKEYLAKKIKKIFAYKK